MFGIGAVLEVADFKRIAQRPVIVLIGSAAQFSIMPLGAFVLARLFELPPEIAVGLILTGSIWASKSVTTSGAGSSEFRVSGRTRGGATTWVGFGVGGLTGVEVTVAPGPAHGVTVGSGVAVGDAAA